jgi:hypothetical protein
MTPRGRGRPATRIQTRVSISARAARCGKRHTAAISITEAAVGLDVHKDSITVAYTLDTGEVELLGRVGTTKTDIDRLCKRLQSKARRIRIVYEAGPCGYGLYRQLVQKGFLHGVRAVADSQEAR